jgi:hypothetical protein
MAGEEPIEATNMGRSDHLCRVYKKYQDTPCSGKELRTWQERSPSKL